MPCSTSAESTGIAFASPVASTILRQSRRRRRASSSILVCASQDSARFWSILASTPAASSFSPGVPFLAREHDNPLVHTRSDDLCGRVNDGDWVECDSDDGVVVGVVAESVVGQIRTTVAGASALDAD